MSQKVRRDRAPPTASPIHDRSPWKLNAADNFSLCELADEPEPIRWTIEPYFPMGCAAALTAAGGSSKTGLMVYFAIHVCLGLPLFGQAIIPGSVLYASAEDNRRALLRHVFANTRDLEPDQLATLQRRLFVKDLVGHSPKLTLRSDGRTRVAPDASQLAEYVQLIGGVRLIVLDTLSRFNGGEESNDDLARVVEAMEHISSLTGAASVIVHHTGKAQARSEVVDQYSGRGGSSLSDNCRSVLHISVPRQNDAPSNASELVSHRRLLKLSHVKSNYAPCAKDRFIERTPTRFAAQLKPFVPQFAKNSDADTWEKIHQAVVAQRIHLPTKESVGRVASNLGISREPSRNALSWAIDTGRVEVRPHPEPAGGRRTYLFLLPAGGVES